MLVPGDGWHRSRHSSSAVATCVEAVFTGAAVGVRDSTRPEGTRLRFGRREWLALVRWAAADNAGRVPG
ncbi:hypothetical protein GCM10027570_02770 [Streptomonospora sediminis]